VRVIASAFFGASSLDMPFIAGNETCIIEWRSLAYHFASENLVMFSLAIPTHVSFGIYNHVTQDLVLNLLNI
jgi:hypothetical protein